MAPQPEHFWRQLGVTSPFKACCHSLFKNSFVTPASIKSQGIKQLMAGGGIALVGATLIPLLSGLFG